MPSARTRPVWTRLLAGGLLFSLASAAVLAGIPIIFGSPLPQVHIQWRDISTPDRIALERRFRLTEATELDTDVWSYVPIDTSRETLRAIVQHPSVEDTNGINRRAFVIGQSPPLTPRRGGVLEEAPPWMARAARALAYVLAFVAGALLITSALTSPAARRGARAIAARRHSLGRVFALRNFSLARSRHGTMTRGLAIAAAVALFVFTIAWRYLTFTGFTNDHYAHLAMAQQMLMGDRPIRDFADPGWPLTYLLTAAAWLVAGDAIGTEWAIVAVGFAAGAACTVAAAYWLSGSLVIATSVAVLEVIIYPRTYSYPKMLVYGAGAWALLALAAVPSPRRIGLMGALVAIAFLFRHDHGLFLGLAAMVVLVLAGREDDWRTTARRVAALAAATALCLLPWVLFVALNGGIVEYFQAGLEYSAGEANATRLRTLPRVAFPLSLHRPANADAWLFWTFWSLPVICGVSAWRRMARGRQRWRGEFAAVQGLVAAAVLVNASFLREALQVRLPDAVVPAALLGAWGLGVCWTEVWGRRVLQRAAQIATIVVVIVSGAAVGEVAGLAAQYDNTGMRRLADLRERSREVADLLRSSHRGDRPSRYSTALLPFFSYLDRCTLVSDRLIVTGEFPDVLVLARRRFAGDGVVFGAWYSSIVHQDRTVRRLRDEPALFVLHMGDYASFRDRFRVVNAYLAKNYESMTEVPVDEGGTIQILVHTTRRAAGVDAGTLWPCFTGSSRG